MILAPRFLPRLAATVGLFTRYGLRDFARQQGLIELSPEEIPGDEAANGDGTTERAVAFRKRLVELGPAYVKLGQVLSTRPDLIPDSYIQQFRKENGTPIRRLTLEPAIDAARKVIDLKIVAAARQ